jgi:hypothetical protein
VYKFSYLYNAHGLLITPRTWIMYAFWLFVHIFSTDNWDYTVFWWLSMSGTHNSGCLCNYHHLHIHKYLSFFMLFWSQKVFCNLICRFWHKYMKLFYFFKHVSMDKLFEVKKIYTVVLNTVFHCWIKINRKRVKNILLWGGWIRAYIHLQDKYTL